MTYFPNQPKSTYHPPVKTIPPVAQYEDVDGCKHLSYQDAYKASILSKLTVLIWSSTPSSADAMAKKIMKEFTVSWS